MSSQKQPCLVLAEDTIIFNSSSTSTYVLVYRAVYPTTPYTKLTLQKNSIDSSTATYSSIRTEYSRTCTLGAIAAHLVLLLQYPAVPGIYATRTHYYYYLLRAPTRDDEGVTCFQV